MWKTDFHQTLWKTDFPQIPWKTEFNRNCVVENDFPQIPWKTRFHCRFMIENTFSTKSMENCIPQNLWKLKWKMIFKKNPLKTRFHKTYGKYFFVEFGLPKADEFTLSQKLLYKSWLVQIVP